MPKFMLVLLAAVMLAAPPRSFAEKKKPVPSSAKKETKNALPSSDLLNSEDKNLPTYVKSDSLTLKHKERTFSYLGNVEVRHGDTTMTADQMEGFYSEKNEIERLVAKNNVYITKGEGIRASGETAVYDAPKQTVTLTDNPELQQGESVLTADRVIIFLNENRSIAEGQVRVKLVKKDSGVSTKVLSGKKK
jgi:lipopolysaccharide export system protein LptA